MYDFLLIVNRDHSCKLLSFFRRLLLFHFGDRQTNGQTDGHHRCVKPQSYYGELQLNNVVFLALKLTWRFGICYGVAACSQSVLKQAWSFIVSTFTFSVLLPRLSLPWRICILAAISSLDRCVVGSQEIASDLDVLCIPVTEHLQLIETRLERWLNCLVSLEHYIIRRNDEKSHDASRTLGADQVQGIQVAMGATAAGPTVLPSAKIMLLCIHSGAIAYVVLVGIHVSRWNCLTLLTRLADAHVTYLQAWLTWVNK